MTLRPDMHHCEGPSPHVRPAVNRHQPHRRPSTIANVYGTAQEKNWTLRAGVVQASTELIVSVTKRRYLPRRWRGGADLGHEATLQPAAAQPRACCSDTPTLRPSTIPQRLSGRAVANRAAPPVIFFLEKNQTCGNWHRCFSRRPDQSGTWNMKKAPAVAAASSACPRNKREASVMNHADHGGDAAARRGSLHHCLHRGECLLVRVKLACGSTKANGRGWARRGHVARGDLCGEANVTWLKQDGLGL